MAQGNNIGFYFNYPEHLWFVDQVRYQEELLRSWERHDWPGVATSLAGLGSPDYLVLPTMKGAWLREVRDLPYVVETRIGDFTILRRGPHHDH